MCETTRLPEYVRAECRAEIRKPVGSMAERASNVHEVAFKYGYLYDHEARGYVYVGACS